MSLLLLIPLGAFGTARWRDADSRYDAAIEVQDRADRLQTLLRLKPALSREELAAVWNGGGQGLVDDLPRTGGENFIPDFGANEVADRALVDQLIADLGNEEITWQLFVVRNDADAGDVGFFDFASRYDEVITLVEASLSEELVALDAAGAQAQAGAVTNAVHIAEAAAGIQVVSAGQETRWAQLVVSDLLPPVLDDGIKFSASVSVFEERVSSLERVAPPASKVWQRWIDVRDTKASLRLHASYRAMVREVAASGIDPTAERVSELRLDNTSLLEILQMADDLKSGLDDAAEFSEGLADVVELSLEEVDRTAFVAVSDANRDRTETTIWTLVFGGLIIGIALATVFAVGRPIRQMANTAELFSQGRLDAKLSEAGPTEIRLGARALNEAMASVRIAEAQAVALAEERFDSEVLQERAPGELGKSLQTAVTRLATSIAERDNFQRRLEHEAAHDHLTDLANRAAILRHLQLALARTRRSGDSLALLFLDIDDFKSINDSYGHHSGDLVLQTIADRLVSTIREGDLAGRLGGDEFVVVAEPVIDIDSAITLSNRIVANVNEPITFEGVTFYPSISVGVGLAGESSKLSADELLRDADSAVYRAKAQGKGRVEVCDENLRSAIQERDTLETAIRRAIDNDELVLYFQPSVHSITRTIVGVEALVRWNRPGIGLVFPDGFIPPAERTDLILDLDRWVLDAAVGQLARWKNDETLRSISVAVNVSGRHLGSGTLCTEVREAIESHGIEASMLVLELTETAVLDDIEIAAKELAVLRDMGVSIALDDFGTGFMSLAHLRQLPVDILKVDRSFVSQIESHADHSLVQLIVNTGHVLGVTITGEGVETETQAAVLERMHVDHLQGYYFSRPVLPDKIVELARNARERGEMLGGAAKDGERV